MAYDANVVLQTLTTQATSFTSGACDLKTGTPRRGLKARLIIESATVGAGSDVLTPTIQVSSDNTTYVTLVTGTLVTVTTATTDSVDYLSFDTSKRYVKIALSQGTTTGTPTIVYRADLGIARP